MNYCIIQDEKDKSTNIWVGKTSNEGRWLPVDSGDYHKVSELTEILGKVDDPQKLMDEAAQQWFNDLGINS
jgi:hypothetical protein|tara:strand:+ start:216 stop:428 length:213 start_codon:yes stop_codon:yes gene_type:complete